MIKKVGFRNGNREQSCREDNGCFPKLAVPAKQDKIKKGYNYPEQQMVNDAKCFRLPGQLNDVLNPICHNPIKSSNLFHSWWNAKLDRPKSEYGS